MLYITQIYVSLLYAASSACQYWWRDNERHRGQDYVHGDDQPFGLYLQLEGKWTETWSVEVVAGQGDKR